MQIGGGVKFMLYNMNEIFRNLFGRFEKMHHLCGVQILLRYEAANIAAFFVPIHIVYLKIL